VDVDYYYYALREWRREVEVWVSREPAASGGGEPPTRGSIMQHAPAWATHLATPLKEAERRRSPSSGVVHPPNPSTNKPLVSNCVHDGT
jgi:hypothetical protein